jgi:hypothetical protein
VTDYITIEDLKGSLELTGTTNYDRDAERAIPAASRAIEEICKRRFGRDASSVDRYYDAQSFSVCFIDDVAEDAEVAVDRTGNYVYTEEWTDGTHYRLQPGNAPADDKPYTMLRAVGGYSFPLCSEGVKVTARFGWLEIPAPVREACAILANKLIVRTRQAPFGIVAAGVDQGAVMRIARQDPDVVMLLEPYMRNRPIV